MNSIITVKKINKTFNRNDEANKVLQNISMEIERGIITTLMGASGVGKSTLLYILGTLEQPDSGEVCLNLDEKQFNYSELSEKELSVLRNRHIGFIFQFHHLLPEFTTVENIILPSLILGISTKEATKKAFSLMEIIGINQTSRQKPSELSGGEQQRVAIARALMNSPEIIFADEPTGNLDSNNSATVMDLLKRINKELGTTFLIATHSKEIAEKSHKTIIMQDGRLTD
jgi:lipoprotein-releasing system ATP-binding protein